VSSAQTAVEAVRKSLVVSCSPERAFEVFTREIGTWWPTHTYHSIGKEKIVEVVFEERVGGRIYERHDDGGEGTWGSVVAWEPPSRFVMKWHPGEDDSRATELEVRFTAEGDRARVDLEHRGWEIYAAEAAETRESYNSGWGEVLGYYERKLNG
jgi:uncharacterized protein YndB with AHSA1/START domain